MSDLVEKKEVPELKLTVGTVITPNTLAEECPFTVSYCVVYANKYFVYLQDMTANRKPVKYKYDVLIQDIEQNRVKLAKMPTPAYMKVPDSELTPLAIEDRDKKLNVIRPILDNLHSYLACEYGKGFINSIAENAGVQRTQIYKFLPKYFRSGCNPNVFLRKPGSGCSENRIIKKKSGPARTITEGVGRPRTKIDEKNIAVILEKWHFKTDPLPISGCFDEFIDQFHSDPIVCPVTGEVIDFDEHHIDTQLSEIQFRTYAEQYKDKHKERLIKAQGKKTTFDKDSRAHTGTIDEYFAEGPGFCFAIDETPGNVELVCQYDPTRQKRLGRPTIYTTRDMTSKGFVGLYLTVRNPSYLTASAALFNTFRKKQEFCAEMGIEIGDDDWIEHGKPMRVMADNAELKSNLARALVKDPKIRVMFNQEGVSSQKGLIERAFGMFNQLMQGRIRGFVPPNLPEFLRNGVRKNALLTIPELYLILITYIINYNRNNANKRIVLHPKMCELGFTKKPRDAWLFGLKYQGGFLRQVETDDLYLTLLEQGEVSLSKEEIKFIGSGLLYKCDNIWITKLRNDLASSNKRSVRRKCRYMRHSVNYILIETPEGLVKADLTANLTPLYKNMSLEEAIEQIRQTKQEDAKNERAYRRGGAKNRAQMKNMQTKALKEQAPMTKNAANTQNIGENRADNMAVENKAHQERFDEAVRDKFGDTKPEAVEPIDTPLNEPPQKIKSAVQRRKEARQRRRNK